MRTTGLTREMRESLAQDINGAKKEYRDWFRLGRELFRPVLEEYATFGMKKSWTDLLDELRSETDMRNGLRETLRDVGLLAQVPDPSGLDDVPWSAMPCTSCWLEYHMAMYYLASFDSAQRARPDFGDQVDFRHAAYAGLSDVYVTGDERMHDILSTMIPSRRGRVVLVSDYIDERIKSKGSL